MNTFFFAVFICQVSNKKDNYTNQRLRTTSIKLSVMYVSNNESPNGVSLRYHYVANC